MKPLRTALFVLGNRPDRTEKAIGLDADAVIIDLEDAVPISEKEKTRPLVRDALESNPGERLIRSADGFPSDDLVPSYM